MEELIPKAKMFLFIEWLHDETDDTRDVDDSLWWSITFEDYVTIEKLYNHWFNKIMG